MALTVILNGQTRSFEKMTEAATLEELVGELGLQADRVAVEHNGAIVARTGWKQTHLREGDRLEVVHFVGGGAGRLKP